MTHKEFTEKYENIVRQVGSVVLGKEQQIRLALACLFAKGHLLIEDIPGIGKTTLAHSLAKVLGLDFRRIQFTSDMLPGDVLGVSILEQKTSTFVFHPGPVFTQVLLADEINRATPKTQSALLEAMEELQVTVEGQTRPLAKPFFVIGTQNPIEQSGTFPLPDSQIDRFLLRIDIGYPDRDSERILLEQGEAKSKLNDLAPRLDSAEIVAIQDRVAQVATSDSLVDYVLNILEYTRSSAAFHVGLSPRAGLGLLRCGQAWALLNNRDYVLPEDIQSVMPHVVGHRLRSARDYKELPRDVLDSMFKEIPIP